MLLGRSILDFTKNILIFLKLLAILKIKLNAISSNITKCLKFPISNKISLKASQDDGKC